MQDRPDSLGSRHPVCDRFTVQGLAIQGLYGVRVRSGKTMANQHLSNFIDFHGNG